MLPPTGTPAHLSIILLRSLVPRHRMSLGNETFANGRVWHSVRPQAIVLSHLKDEVDSIS